MNTTILLILIVSIAIILLIVMFIPSKKTGNTSSNKPREIFELKAGRKTIKFFNPYIGFLVYGGAGSGKTKSIASFSYWQEYTTEGKILSRNCDFKYTPTKDITLYPYFQMY